MYLHTPSVGKYFPKGNHYLEWVATFQGKSATSDIVGCKQNPSFNIEFSWSLKSSALQKLKNSRCFIRLQCNIVDKSKTTKESLGYSLVDVRSIASGTESRTISVSKS